MNRIEKIEGLDGCVGLEKLILYGNEISRVEGMDKLS
jgi:hypothetical protein